jgi:ATP-dependent Lon protease
MKESASIALSYVRAHAGELGIDGDVAGRRYHVHVPAGAVPKDGPSAGVTMTTALASLLTGRPVRAEMTFHLASEIDQVLAHALVTEDQEATQAA